MTSSVGRSWALQAAILVLAILGAFFVGYLQRSSGKPRSGDPDPGTDLSPLRDQVADLRQTLDGIDERTKDLDMALAQILRELQGLAARSPTREVLDPEGAAPESVGDLTASIQELRNSVKAQLEETRFLADQVAASQALGKNQAAMLEKPEADWNALRGLISSWNLDQEAALEEVRLLSSDQIIRRFGPPTKVWSRGEGVAWLYGTGHFDEESKKYETEVFLQFLDGAVANMSVKQ